MKFDGSTKCSRSSPQSIAFRPRPRSPLNNHTATNPEEFLGKLRLKVLDPFTRLALPKTDLHDIHPLVRAEANGMQVLLNLPGVGGLAGTRQATNDDEFRTTLEFGHIELVSYKIQVT